MLDVLTNDALNATKFQRWTGVSHP